MSHPLRNEMTKNSISFIWGIESKPCSHEGHACWRCRWYFGKTSVGGSLRVLAYPFCKLQHGDVHGVQWIIGNPHVSNTQKYSPAMLGKSEVISKKYLTYESLYYPSYTKTPQNNLDLISNNSQFPVASSYEGTHTTLAHICVHTYSSTVLKTQKTREKQSGCGLPGVQLDIKVGICHLPSSPLPEFP